MVLGIMEHQDWNMDATATLPMEIERLLPSIRKQDASVKPSSEERVGCICPQHGRIIMVGRGKGADSSQKLGNDSKKDADPISLCSSGAEVRVYPSRRTCPFRTQRRRLSYFHSTTNLFFSLTVHVFHLDQSREGPSGNIVLVEVRISPRLWLLHRGFCASISYDRMGGLSSLTNIQLYCAGIRSGRDPIIDLIPHATSQGFTYAMRKGGYRPDGYLL